MDGDYAYEGNDRRYVSGGDIMLAGACVSFHSKTQKSTTLSSVEAEY